MRVPLHVRAFDLASAAVTPLAAALAKLQTRYGPVRLPHTYRMWDRLGLMPVPYHYYQPVFHPAQLPESTWSRQDEMRGVDLNVPAQLELLQQLRYAGELKAIPIEDPGSPRRRFFYNNDYFPSGDAEILYGMIRHFRPRRYLEIGAGFSTLLAIEALEKNRSEGHAAEHIAIEPYENPWLEQTGVNRVIRSRVEEMDLALFDQLEANDILFIDSSHVLRTGGDVVFEYLQVLPRLKKGVLVHLHDIFLPFEYPRFYPQEARLFWTEQYLLQAFLAFNSSFEVVLALVYLARQHRSRMDEACPVFAQQPDRTPASFWMRRKL